MTTTPNPTAEQIVYDVLGQCGMLLGTREHAARNAVERLRAHGLLSEGAPSEEQIELGAAVLFESCDEHVEYSWPEFAEVYPERASSLRSESRRVIEAAGVAPQEPNQNETKSGKNLVSLDRSKVQDHLYFALRDAGEGRSTSERLASVGTRALCEAYTEGKLTK